MASGLDLLLSPHPDDLVYSAYAYASDPNRTRQAVTGFNVSGFTRFGILPVVLVTPLRTVEDQFALRMTGVRTRFLYGRDSLARGDDLGPPIDQLLNAFAGLRPERIVVPLGVGDNHDHTLIRDVGISIWKRLGCTIVFYEDLPYAARMGDPEAAGKSIFAGLSLHADVAPRTLTPCQMKRKLMTSRLYASQADKTELLRTHASKVGRSSGSEFAERYYTPSSGQ